MSMRHCLGCAELRKFVFRVYPVFVLQIESRTEAKANGSQRNDGLSPEGTTDELPLATANGRLPFGSQAPVGATDTMMHIFYFVAPVGAFEYKVLRPRVVTLGNTSTVPPGRIRNKTEICLQQNPPQYCGFRAAQVLPAIRRHPTSQARNDRCPQHPCKSDFDNNHE